MQKIRSSTVLLILALLIIAGCFASLFKNQNHPTKQKNATSYVVSLGDSVAAGAGLELASTNTESILCGQSDFAYPYIIALRLHLTLKQFACSGASIPAGVLSSQTVDKYRILPQLSSAKNVLKNSIVVISVGANDTNWLENIDGCISGKCIYRPNQPIHTVSIDEYSVRLSDLLKLLAAYHPHEVLLNTYYEIAASSDNCLATHGLSTAELAWVNGHEAILNSVIRGESAKYHDHAVSIKFTNHMLCNSDPWIQGLTSKAPFHPTRTGQQFIAQADLSAIESKGKYFTPTE